MKSRTTSKVALYVRAVSPKDRNAKIQVLRQFARKHGYGVGATFIDPRTHGQNERLPAFGRMFDEIEAKRFEVVIMVNWDEIADSPLHALELLRVFDLSAVKVIAADDEVDLDSQLGRIFLYSSVTAAAEYRQLSEHRPRASDLRAGTEGVKHVH